MNAWDIKAELAEHPAGNTFVFGVVVEDEDILAFGRETKGTKVRVGSISRQDDDQFLVIQFPNSEEEYKADSIQELGWFLWKLAETSSWEAASDWMRR